MPLQSEGRRPATQQEMRALASPIRLRIMRLVLDQSLTNKEIADLLRLAPANTLHHVRTLVDAGFLVAEPVRRGSRGSRERPYRATRLSWSIDTADADPSGLVKRASLQAFLAEIEDIPAVDTFQHHASWPAAVARAQGGVARAAWRRPRRVREVAT